MYVQDTGIINPAPFAAFIKPETPPPTFGATKSMDATVHPNVDPLPVRNFNPFAHLCLGKNDITACTIVVNGTNMGVYSRRARVFSLYGKNAPTVEIIPIYIDKPLPYFAPETRSSMPYQNSAFILKVTTDANTKAGKYRTNIEIEGENEVDYLSVVIDVADVLLNEYQITESCVSEFSQLDILLSAAKNTLLKPTDLNGYNELLFQIAKSNMKLYRTAIEYNPTLANILINSLAKIKDQTFDDSGLIAKVRKTMLYSMDEQFDCGNKEPLISREIK